jgi:TolB-like protein
MSSTSRPGATRGGQKPAADAIADQLDRILDNPDFQGSPKRKAMLRYIVEETLAGRADRLKGFTVAVEVFGRDETFDAQTDPVVRLEARRLRRDLDGYYVAAGSTDPILISIPKGHYVPAFEWREPNDISQEAIPDGAPPPERAAGHAEPERRDPAENAPPVAAGVGRRPGRRLRVVLAGMTLSAAIAALMWFGPRPRMPDPAAQRDARGPSVIVLPFEALSPGEDSRYLAVGMTLELISDLMRFDGFRVYSIPASFRQQADADAAALGRSLAVSYVVKGSITSGGDALRIGAQLLDGATGEVLWSQTYDRAPTPYNLLEMQEELAGRMATLLGEPYGVVNRHAADMFRRQTVPSAPTYVCTLRAYEYRRTFSFDLHAPTLACLQDSVRRDPDYSDAWALLAWLHLDAARYKWVPEAEIEATYRQAVEEGRHAVELDEDSNRALQALASILYYVGEFEESEDVQRRALARNPNDPETLAQLGWRLAARGNWEEGLAYLRQAIDRTVSPPGWYYHLVSVHDYLQGNYAEALAGAERSGRRGSSMGLSFMAINQAALGDMDAARESLETLGTFDPEFLEDPAAVYRTHQATEEIVSALVEGLRKAGWREPERSARP